MHWPWISREMHEQVVSAKDALIRLLEAQNAVLAVRLEEPIAVTVRLPENFAMVQPAIVRRKQPQDPESPAKRVETDWASVDENDPVQIAEIAAQELGPGYTPYQLSQCVARIKFHARTAKAERAMRSQERGTVGVIQSEEPHVPERIQKIIEDAERG